nr:hypothetical protein [Acaryochloris sp. CCMEE 5410]
METNEKTSELRKADLRPIQVHPSPAPNSEYCALEVCTPEIRIRQICSSKPTQDQDTRQIQARYWEESLH